MAESYCLFQRHQLLNMIQITRIQVIFMAFLKCRLLFLRSIKAWTFDQVRFIQETLRNIQCQRFCERWGKVTNYVGANAETELELTNEKMPNKLTFGPKRRLNIR